MRAGFNLMEREASRAWNDEADQGNMRYHMSDSNGNGYDGFIDSERNMRVLEADLLSIRSRGATLKYFGLFGHGTSHADAADNVVLGRFVLDCRWRANALGYGVARQVDSYMRGITTSGTWIDLNMCHTACMPKVHSFFRGLDSHVRITGYCQARSSSHYGPIERGKRLEVP
jgi:hypothetical protein